MDSIAENTTQDQPFHQDATSLAAEIAQRCEQATPTSDGWQACCPSHEDGTPSLSITPTGNRVLMHCHAGCTNSAIVAALGLTLGDLFVKKSSGNGSRRIVQLYDYFDAAGTLVHQTVRYEPKAFKQRRPDPARPGAYVWNLQGIEPVLYNLPAVLQAIHTETLVHLAEGEKDAQTLIRLGLVATTVPMGAKYWRESYTTTLTGAHVVLWPDNDTAGQACTAKVTRQLTGKAKTLRMVTVPAPHKDVSDWVKAGATPAEVQATVEAATLPPAPEEPRPARDAPMRPEPALPYSDYTNALAFVRDHGQQLRFCFPWNAWLVWTGTHWQRDVSGAVMRLAKQTVKRLARQIEGLDDKAAHALMAHIKSSLSTAKLKAMIENAQSEPGIAVQPEDLDTNPWLINCTNGTLDLQTGALRPHTPLDLITKCLTIPYDPDARCPTWEAFQWRIMGGSQGEDSPDMSSLLLETRQAADQRAQRLITFKQRYAGYALTGSTREQCLCLYHGTGSNGKTTELETLKTLLGAYAQSTPSASLLAKDRHDGILNDIARLRGARLVTAVEIGDGKRLDEELIKRLTGGDTMTARFLHAEFFDFTPQFKLIVACNHLPQIRGGEHAIWRRLHRIPFTVTIPDGEQDKTLPAQLQEELPGILRWLVQGCLDWQQEGLGVPEEVQEADNDYRTSMDVVGRFIEECCLVSAEVRTKASDLYGAYKKWCEANNEYATSQTAFGTRLEDKGFHKRLSGGVWRLGIGLLSSIKTL